jgi:hypothetical protein
MPYVRLTSVPRGPVGSFCPGTYPLPLSHSSAPARTLESTPTERLLRLGRMRRSQNLDEPAARGQLEGFCRFSGSVTAREKLMTVAYKP